MTFVVFVVDDDAAVLQALERLLRSGGYEVRTYGSAESFLADYDTSVPGCAVVDLVMPGMDGVELQARLAVLDPDRPVILVTGTADAATTDRAMKAGAVDVLSKPVDEAVLFGALERARKTYEQRACRA